MYINWKFPLPVFEAKSLDEAHKEGFFEHSISRWKLLEIIKKRNRGIHFKTNGKFSGFYKDNSFICGCTPILTIPRYTIIKRDKDQDKRISFSTPDGEITSSEIHNEDEELGKVLARGWQTTLKIIKAKGFDIRDEDIEP